MWSHIFPIYFYRTLFLIILNMEGRRENSAEFHLAIHLSHVQTCKKNTPLLITHSFVLENIIIFIKLYE